MKILSLLSIFSTSLLLSLSTASPLNPIQSRASAYQAYLTTYFVGDNPKIFQQLSNGNTAIEFTPLNSGNPILTPSASGGTGGVRDPYLVSSPDSTSFWILGTDLDVGKTTWDKATRTGSRSIYVWYSKDLVNWQKDYLVQLEDKTAGMVWAPSAVYVAGQYYVFWSSRFYSSSDPSHTGTAGQDVIRYSTTKDFKTFSSPSTYLSIPGTPIIDQEFQALSTANHFSRFIKNETNNRVWQEISSGGLFGTWSRVGGSQGYVTQDVREGAASFKDNLDPNVYHLWLDDYSGNGNYIPYQTSNIEKGAYTKSTAPKFPSGLRHGSITPVTQAQYNALKAKI